MKENKELNALKEKEQKDMTYNIFISGSICNPVFQYWNDNKIRELMFSLGHKLTEYRWKDKVHLKIITGYGTGIGAYLCGGVAYAVMKNNYNIEDYLQVCPFPQVCLSDNIYGTFISPLTVSPFRQYGEELTSSCLTGVFTETFSGVKDAYYEYREKMISKSDAVFFLFGSKFDNNKVSINAYGVEQEFNIAVKQGKYVFPIGATQYMAKELAEKVLADFKTYNRDMMNVKNILQDLNNNHIDVDCMVEKILGIINILIEEKAKKLNW